MALAVVISTLPASPASGQQVGVPIFVIGMDDGLSPAVIRRNSEEFREVVFRLLAQALARGGFRAVGEKPFRARFDVDGVPGERLSRWESHDFLHYASQVAVDDAGNTVPYLVFVDVWERVCRDDMTHICVDLGARIHETASGKHVFSAGPPELRIPIPPGCGGACIWQLWHTQSERLLHTLGAALSGFIPSISRTVLPAAEGDALTRRAKVARPRDCRWRLSCRLRDLRGQCRSRCLPSRMEP